MGKINEREFEARRCLFISGWGRVVGGEKEHFS